jgi:heme A synthase
MEPATASRLKGAGYVLIALVIIYLVIATGSMVEGGGISNAYVDGDITAEEFKDKYTNGFTGFFRKEENRVFTMISLIMFGALIVINTFTVMVFGAKMLVNGEEEMDKVEVNNYFFIRRKSKQLADVSLNTNLPH